MSAMAHELGEYELEGEGEFEYEGELEGEFEYEGELEGEFEAVHEGEFEFEHEGEFEGAHEYEFEAELEGEFEAHEYEFEGELEGEFEGEQFFKSIRRFVKRAAPILRQVAKIAAPIVGTAVGGPLGGTLGRFVSSQLEGEFEGEFEAAMEAPLSESQAVAELMAAVASRARTEAETEAMIGAAAYSTLSPQDRAELLDVLPSLVRGAAVLARILRGQPGAAPAVRLVPGIVGTTGRILANRAAAGAPITRAVAGRIMAAQARRVLSSPRLANMGPQRNVRGARVARRRPLYGRPGVRRPAYGRPAYRRPIYARPGMRRPMAPGIRRVPAGVRTMRPGIPIARPVYRPVVGRVPAGYRPAPARTSFRAPAAAVRRVR